MSDSAERLLVSTYTPHTHSTMSDSAERLLVSTYTPHTHTQHNE